MTPIAAPLARSAGGARAPADLGEEVERVDRELRRLRLALAVRRLAGLDTRRTGERVREAADRLACLRYQRHGRTPASPTAWRPSRAGGVDRAPASGPLARPEA